MLLVVHKLPIETMTLMTLLLSPYLSNSLTLPPSQVSIIFFSHHARTVQGIADSEQ